MRPIKIKNILFCLVVSLGIFLRFFLLDSFPVQLNHDEVSQLVDVSSIVKTGRDIYGNFLPLAFPSTGDFKPGHYIYISVVPYLLFGDKEFTIRIPSAFFGSLTVVAVFLFINALAKNWAIALLSALMVAITPSEIFYSRKSFENVIGVCLNFFGLFCLLNTLDVKKNKLWGYVGVVIFALVMYIYTSQIIIVPFLLISFIFIFKNSIKRKQFLKIFPVWLILLIPLIFMTITNPGLRFRAASVFITQDVSLGNLINLSQNPFKSYIDFILLKYLNQFNPVYLFANGLDLTNQGILGTGPLLLWQLPFVVLGMVFLIKENLPKGIRELLLSLVVIGFIPSALTFEERSPHRAMLAFTTFSIISAFGLYYFLNTIKHIKINLQLKRLIYLLTFFLLFFNFIYFMRVYTISFPFEKSQHMSYPFKDVSQFVWSQYKNFDHIIWDPKFGTVAPMVGVATHYYLVYFGNFNPADFQKMYRVDKIKGELSFDKFSIRPIIWAEDQNLKNTLIIASSWSIPLKSIDKGEIIKTFNFYNGQPAFYAIKL